MFYGRTKESKFYFRTSRLRRSINLPVLRGIHLQLLDDVLGTGELEVVHLRLTSSVGDLAVVEDNGVTTSTTVLVSPADALGELGVGVGEEELQQLVYNAQLCILFQGFGLRKKRTMSSFLTPLALPQALMTKASL